MQNVNCSQGWCFLLLFCTNHSNVRGIEIKLHVSYQYFLWKWRGHFFFSFNQKLKLFFFLNFGIYNYSCHVNMINRHINHISVIFLPKRKWQKGKSYKWRNKRYYFDTVCVTLQRCFPIYLLYDNTPLFPYNTSHAMSKDISGSMSDFRRGLDHYMQVSPKKWTHRKILK